MEEGIFYLVLKDEEELVRGRGKGEVSIFLFLRNWKLAGGAVSWKLDFFFRAGVRLFFRVCRSVIVFFLFYVYFFCRVIIFDDKDFSFFVNV